MTRRRALWLTGVLSLVLLGVEAAFDVRMQDAGGHGIIDFELAGSLAHSRRILEFWGHDGHVAARWSLWFDYAYLIAYGAFWALAVAAVRDLARRRRWRRFARVGAVLVAFPIAAASFDAIENVGLLLALGRHGGAFAPRLASVCATAKFVLIEIAILFVIVALVRRGLERRRVATAVLIGLFAAAFIALLVDGVVVTNRTRAADPTAGTIIHEPGGDIHVSDEGPRRRDAIVLIHGWGCSMKWWAAAGRVLARHARVIRVDLLGFGASSKPGTGYSMENEARLVLGAIGQLGVRRSVVIGHSMGGDVAVSAAEQARTRVAGVGIVDTPPRPDSGAPSVSENAARIPIIGAALFDLAPTSLLRSGMRSGFARGFRVPPELADDLRRASFTALGSTAEHVDDFVRERALDERMRATDKPLLVIYGRSERLVDPKVAAAWFVPRVRIVGVPHAGHSPQVERPTATAAIIARFARPLLRR